MELNLAVVRGPLSSAPDLRTLPSGAEVANLAVRTPVDGKATSVPITRLGSARVDRRPRRGRRAARARRGPSPLLPGRRRHGQPRRRRGVVRRPAGQAPARRVHPPDPGVARASSPADPRRRRSGAGVHVDRVAEVGRDRGHRGVAVAAAGEQVADLVPPEAAPDREAHVARGRGRDAQPVRRRAPRVRRRRAPRARRARPPAAGGARDRAPRRRDRRCPRPSRGRVRARPRAGRCIAPRHERGPAVCGRTRRRRRRPRAGRAVGGTIDLEHEARAAGGQPGREVGRARRPTPRSRRRRRRRCSGPAPSRSAGPRARTRSTIAGIGEGEVVEARRLDRHAPRSGRPRSRPRAASAPNSSSIRSPAASGSTPSATAALEAGGDGRLGGDDRGAVVRARARRRRSRSAARWGRRWSHGEHEPRSARPASSAAERTGRRVGAESGADDRCAPASSVNSARSAVEAPPSHRRPSSGARSGRRQPARFSANRTGCPHPDRRSDRQLRSGRARAAATGSPGGETRSRDRHDIGDPPAGEPGAGGHPVRRRLRRRHAARRRPLHRRERRLRQRPRHAAELPGRDPGSRRHHRRRVELPGPHRRLRHRDPGRRAQPARRDEPGGAEGEHRRPRRPARRSSPTPTRSSPATSRRPATSATRSRTTRSPRSPCTRCR